MKNIEWAGTRELGDLAEQINEEHRHLEGTFGAASDHAIRAGELLIEAKARCPHGTWQTWLEENFEGAVKATQSYMREASGQPKRMCCVRR